MKVTWKTPLHLRRKIIRSFILPRPLFKTVQSNELLKNLIICVPGDNTFDTIKMITIFINPHVNNVADSPSTLCPDQEWASTLTRSPTWKTWSRLLWSPRLMASICVAKRRVRMLWTQLVCFNVGAWTWPVLPCSLLPPIQAHWTIFLEVPWYDCYRWIPMRLESLVTRHHSVR